MTENKRTYVTIHTEEDKRKILLGAKKVVDVVSRLVGPSAFHVAYSTGNYIPFVSQDGATVLKEIQLPDPLEDIGARWVRFASQKTNDLAGDGTTTTALLSYKLMEHINRLDAAGYNFKDIEEEFIKLKDEITKKIKEMSSAMTDADIERISFSACNDSELSKLIKETITKIGKNGIFTVEDSYSDKMEVVIEEGSIFEGGYSVPGVGYDTARERVYERAKILLTDETIEDFGSLQKICNDFLSKGHSVVLITGGIHSRFVPIIEASHAKGVKIASAKAPLYGDKRSEYLEDMAVMTGGTVLSWRKGLSYRHVVPELFGSAEKVKIRKDKTIILNGEGKEEDIMRHTELIRGEILRAPSSYERERLQERLAKFLGGLAVIKVGGNRLENRLAKYRIEDAIKATQAAMEEGIVPGGGMCLMRSLQSKECPSELLPRAVYNAFYDAFEFVFDCIMNSATRSKKEMRRLSVNLFDSTDSFSVLDATTGEMGNMRELGIVDPTKVSRLSLENAVSSAITFLRSKEFLVKNN